MEINNNKYTLTLLQNCCISLRNFMFAQETFVMEIIWGWRKNYISVLCEQMQSFSEECNIFARERKCF